MTIYSPNAIVCTKLKLKREKGKGGLQNRSEACSERPVAWWGAGHALLCQEKSNKAEDKEGSGVSLSGHIQIPCQGWVTPAGYTGMCPNGVPLEPSK